MPVRPAAPPPTLVPPLVPSARALAARTWVAALDLDSSAARALTVARTKAPTMGPVGVQRAFSLYRTWQERDLGSVRLLRGELDGRELFLLHTTTDGDDSFIEVFDARGAMLASGVKGADGAIAWDDELGAVRDRVASFEGAPSVEAFLVDVLAGEHAASAGRDRLVTDELRVAAAHLVGADLALRSIDGREGAALFRILADAHTLTPAARAYALRLGELYATDAPKELRKVKARPLERVTGAQTPFSSGASCVSAEVKGKKDAPRLLAFSALLRATHEAFPTKLTPATQAEVIAALKGAGATSAEARACVDELKSGGARLFVGRIFAVDATFPSNAPRDTGLAVFAATADGKRVRAVVVPQAGSTPVTAAMAARTAVSSITGVDRPIDEVTAVTAGVTSLSWRPPVGGSLAATLDLSNPAGPQVVSVELPPVLEPALRESLTNKLGVALGRDVEVLGWVGRDDASGPGFVVAHRDRGALAPVSLVHMHIQIGGAASIAALALSTSADDREVSRDLALVLARVHAERMVQDPSMEDAARLEVALRTRYALTADLEELDASSSPVGFDPHTERVQWMLPRVWGDNAVVVTFAQDGTLRVEDVN